MEQFFPKRSNKRIAETKFKAKRNSGMKNYIEMDAIEKATRK